MNLPPGLALSDIGCICLVVLDGWGIAPDGPANAIAQANTPVFDELWNGYAHTALSASGPSVGLPEGQMGNSEVGHLTPGAGAVVPQTLTGPITARACPGEAVLTSPRSRPSGTEVGRDTRRPRTDLRPVPTIAILTGGPLHQRAFELVLRMRGQPPSEHHVPAGT